MPDEKQKQDSIPVTIRDTEGKGALVEYEINDRLRRSIVAVEAINEMGSIDVEELEKYPEYGIRWEEFIHLVDFTEDEIADRLRRAGIWTMEDLQERDRVIIRIATDTLGAAIWAAAKRACGQKK